MLQKDTAENSNEQVHCPCALECSIVMTLLGCCSVCAWSEPVTSETGLLVTYATDGIYFELTH